MWCMLLDVKNCKGHHQPDNEMLPCANEAPFPALRLHLLRTGVILALLILGPLQVLIGDLRLVSSNNACFHLRTAPPPNASAAHGGAPAALLVVLEAGEMDGEFSDNLFTLEPCGRPKTVCFSNADAAAAAAGQEGAASRQGALDLEVLRSSLTVMALNSDGSLWWESEDVRV